MAASRSSAADRRSAQRSLVRRSVLVVVVIALAVTAVVLRPPQLGLDLRGGTQITFETRPTAEVADEEDTLDRTIEVLRRRVDSLGVSEPTLLGSGDNRIIVELPGVTDAEQALEVIGRTAQLTFHPVLGVDEASFDEPDDPETEPDDPQDADAEDAGADAEDADAEDADGEEAEADVEGPDDADSEAPDDADDGTFVLSDDQGLPLRLGPTALSGNDVSSAGTQLGRMAQQYDVTVDFRGPGEQAWQELTADAACFPEGDPQRRVAIVLDQEIISSPQVSPEVQCGQGITGGSTSITGDFTDEESTELALLIRAGALPVPIEDIAVETIGPTLGEGAISASLLASVIGVAATLIFMVIAYRLYGFIASLALALYGLLSYAALVAIGATLTLPGIAGFVLAVGMAVDANVLVFERSKEEYADGRSPRAATNEGFKNAFSAIIDSNITTVIAAVLLIFFASGAVQGFGVTLTIGVLVSMFTALVVTRVVVEWLLRFPSLAKRVGLLGLTALRQIREWLDRRQPDLMGRGRLWIGLSAFVLVTSIGGMVTQGFNFGLEFTGGVQLVYDTERPVDIDELRSAIEATELPTTLVQTTGDDEVSLRTGSVTPEQQGELRDLVAERGGELDIVREVDIGPSIGDELRRNALIALTIALLGQMLYLAVRFRWHYGLATLVGMVHDVALLVGVFAWLGKTFDGVFLAALLSAVGYSINDTVVIFDRIREKRGLEPDRPLKAITNQALIQTLPRTINTGTGALFILVALYVLGGDTLADFSLALIIGTTVGMYSSLFVAAPLLGWLERMRPPPPDPEPKKNPIRPSGSKAVV